MDRVIDQKSHWKSAIDHHIARIHSSTRVPMIAFNDKACMVLMLFKTLSR